MAGTAGEEALTNCATVKGKRVEESGACVEVSDQMLALVIRHNWKIHKYTPPKQNRMNYWSLVASWRKTANRKYRTNS